MSTITREQAQKIIEAADEVITALAGTNEDVHPESDNMLRLWDDLNDRYAPPEVVRELARIALASLEAEAVTEWTNEQCLEFLSIAFRHAKIKGDLELDDIRLGVKMVNGSRAAMLQGADGNSRCWQYADSVLFIWPVLSRPRACNCFLMIYPLGNLNPH